MQATNGVLTRAGDQHGNIRVWDLTANACSCELVPEVGTAVRSITVALDGSLVVAANNQGGPLRSAAPPLVLSVVLMGIPWHTTMYLMHRRALHHRRAQRLPRRGRQQLGWGPTAAPCRNPPQRCSGA